MALTWKEEETYDGKCNRYSHYIELFELLWGWGWGKEKQEKKSRVTKEMVAISNRMVRVGLSERVTFEASLEGDEGVSIRVCGDKLRQRSPGHIQEATRRPAGWTCMNKGHVVDRRS